MLRSALLTALVFTIGCSSPPKSKDTKEKLASFTGFVDSSRGLFAVAMGNHDPVTMENYALTQLDIEQDGNPGTGTANTVELVTLSTGSGALGCDRENSFCGSVRVRSFYTDEIRGAHVEINSMFPATGNEAFGDNPDAYGHSGALGLWSYGNLGANGQADRTWKFNDTAGTAFTFNGFVVGQVEPAANPTETNCADALDNDGDTDFDCNDPDCGADPACTGGEVCGNGIEDDADGNTDCEDTDCSGDTSLCTPYDDQCFMAYNTITEPTRSVNNTDPPYLCDSGLATDWYRFTGAGGTMIPEAFPIVFSCGTDDPGWMNGTHPVESDGVVTRQICYHGGGDICNNSNNVDVVACDGFYLYELQAPPACDLGYCTTHPTSCNDLLTKFPTTPSGNYFIDPDGNGGSDAFSVYCDMTTDGGGWTLVAYAAGANLGGTLDTASGGYDGSLRTGSENIDATLLVGSSTEFTFAWTSNGGGFPTGNIGSYEEALRSPIPAGQDLTAAADTSGRNCADPTYWTAVNAECDTSCNEIPFPPGGGGMHTPTNMQDGCYGNAYALVRSNGINPSCDWTIDTQTYRVVYMRHGANASCEGVVQWNGGINDLIIPDTLSMWMR